MCLNIKLRGIISRRNLTLRLMPLDHWKLTLNEAKCLINSHIRDKEDVSYCNLLSYFFILVHTQLWCKICYMYCNFVTCCYFHSKISFGIVLSYCMFIFWMLIWVCCLQSGVAGVGWCKSVWSHGRLCRVAWQAVSNVQTFRGGTQVGCRGT